MNNITNNQNLKQLLGSVAATACITSIITQPAQAFSFQTNFDAALTGAQAAKGDILLQSVEFEGRTFDGITIDNFALVNQANIVSNDLWTRGNAGAASADLGDLATVGLKQEDVDNQGVVAALGNMYLSSIIDTEDKGNFAIDLRFEQAVDNLFFWERGMNSKLDVQALDADGNVIGNLLNLDSNNWNYAGYKLNTKEIKRAQKVGSLGVSLNDLGVVDPITGIRVISRGRKYNGPDWKVIGSAASGNQVQPVPEPGTVISLALLGIPLIASRRQRNASDASHI
ncbi:MAG: PEP-CTERM sorting domain-containing protein [Symploca sp. SIO3C6]|uniref:PEP-CTERM sorting domain-containing protein n=1 Tax=Symploca sp. SIO1C4 TaxID=2607765 RepID=A0A6B3N5M5_9CYAN|nr:PEP-CTERM sorting domain-containing protein [Symploca sp. SIO3C6]NER26853.1 PEP-CTERM sorting domain-containing protein [Symploca sp. SIO1C4]